MDIGCVKSGVKIMIEVQNLITPVLQRVYLQKNTKISVTDNLSEWGKRKTI